MGDLPKRAWREFGGAKKEVVRSAIDEIQSGKVYGLGLGDNRSIGFSKESQLTVDGVLYDVVVGKDGAVNPMPGSTR